jgi:hypothetical protein
MRMSTTQRHITKTKVTALVFTVTCLLMPLAIAEKSATLQAKPERCVALNEGQVCYQKTILSWQTDDIADYCLYELSSPEPITCWLNTNRGKIKIDFASASSKQYHLTLKKIMTPIVNTTIEVTWVYSEKKKRRTSWRLF